MGGFIAGLTNAMGDPTLMQRGERELQRRKAWEDTGRQQSLDDYNSAIQNLQGKLYKPDGTVDPQVQDELKRTISARTALFNPANGPNAFAGIGKLLHFGGKKPAQPATPAEAKASMADVLSWGAPENPDTKALREGRTQTQVLMQGIDDMLSAIPKYFPNAKPEEIEKFKNEYLQSKFGIATTNRPVFKEYVSPDGKQRQWFDASRADTIPDGWQAVQGSQRPIAGTLVRSKQSPTGWAKTWVSPTDPSKIVGWQPTTPSRYYQGTTTMGSTTDPAGVTSTSTHTTRPLPTGDVDLSGVTEMPFEDVTPPASAPSQPAPQPSPVPKKSAVRSTPMTPGQLKQRAAAAAGVQRLDATGHIPESANVNPQLREAANQLIDGADMNKLTIPQRDRPAAEALARKYGWQGQGLFTPKEQLLLRESETYLNQAVNNPALAALDSASSRMKLANMLQQHKGVISSTVAATWHLNPQEQEFIRMYNQLVGTISGLAQLTRSGRATEATINRLMMELPNPEQSHSSADAKQRIKRLLSEISVARQKGMFSAQETASQNGPQNGALNDAETDAIIRALNGSK